MTVPITAQVQGFISGGTSTAPQANQVLAIYCAPTHGRMRRVVAAVQPGTQGNLATILDVRKNGTSVWTNAAHRPTLPASAPSGVFTTYSPDNGSIVPGDIVTLVVVQAGNNSNVAMTVAVEEP